ncbi:hypothetical protein [Agromyces subbeticus]|uniref:hypothetical protein n=1 Tax=Agromyces subbeticus TaxID=293890 RepID=UPI0003B3E762|nr:hypothetical protein [Agromyces subbeticus]
MPAPIARPHDPETSWNAAEAQTTSRRQLVQAAIVTLINNHGPLSDERLVDLYEAHCFMHPSVPPATPQNVRTRRSELVAEGKVRAASQRGRTRTGSTCQLWTLA